MPMRRDRQRPRERNRSEMRQQRQPSAPISPERDRQDETDMRAVPAPARPSVPRPQPQAEAESALSGPLADPFADSPLATRSALGAELDGMEELGPQLNWVSLDAPRGVLVCKNLDLETEEFIGAILESRVVRVMKDSDGEVTCASSDRLTADVGRPGRDCATCEDRDEGCRTRWWIAWREEESGLVFAHTLSQTGTLNFTRYVNSLQREKLTPSQVSTRIYVEEAQRRRTGTPYRRVQFERNDPFA